MARARVSGRDGADASQIRGRATAICAARVLPVPLSPPPSLPRRMSEIPSLLLASLNPSTRKEAETNLQALSVQPGFLSVLLRLVLEQSQDRSVRLAGSVYLKNVIKNRWDDVRGSDRSPYIELTREQEDKPIPENDKAALRNELIPAMIALSNASDKAMRAQVAESVSIIAGVDFPDKWPDLVDVSTIQLGRGCIRLGATCGDTHLMLLCAETCCFAFSDKL